MTGLRKTLMYENQGASSRFIILMAAAFFIKAAILFVAFPTLGHFLSNRYNLGFADGYDQIANNLAQGSGYRFRADMSETMIREPGYPLLLASVFKIVGYHIEAARFVNLLLAFGIAFMMMRLTRRVTGDEVTALIATLLLLFHPGILIAEARGGVEIAFIFCVLAFMLALHHAVEKGNSWRYFVAGALLGVAVQVRSTPLLFPIFLLLYLVITAKGASERAKGVLNVVILVLGLAVVMLPWVIRNYMLVQEFVPTATVQGLAAQEGLYTCQHLSFRRDFYLVQTEARHERNKLARVLQLPSETHFWPLFYDARDEVAFQKGLLQMVALEYGKSPSLLASCIGKNLFNFWFLGRTWQTTWLNALIQVPLLLLALSGLRVLWKRGLLPQMGIMLTFVLYIVAVHVPILAHTRYSIPMIPFLAIPASVSLLSIWHKYKQHIPKKETGWGSY